MTSGRQNIRAHAHAAPVPAPQTWWLTCVVFAAATAGFFLTYHVFNDHFDRLARARQIARFGAVPFRDFFDPGYFLTLYASAAVERLAGDNLLGELILNIACMSAGAALVFRLAARTSGSTIWGLASAAIVVAAQPRAYDYDKVLFFPLGLAACFAYADRPRRLALAGLAGTIALAALFRYDSGVYLGAGAVATIVVRHGRDWKATLQRLGALALLVALALAPALAFVEWTTGLSEATRQIVTYAQREGARSLLLHPISFEAAPAATFVTRYVTRNNAAAWLYVLSVGLPALVGALMLGSQRERSSSQRAQQLAFIVVAELSALFVLRFPIAARIGGVMGLSTIGLGYIVREGQHCWYDLRRDVSRARRRTSAGLLLGGVAIMLLTTASLVRLVNLPAKANLHVGQRLKMFATTPPALDLWPLETLQPVVQYLRACTKPDDRVLVGWFGGEVLVFSGRGFAAGLPVVFGEHWSDVRDQEREVDRMSQESVPIVLTRPEDNLGVYETLWAHITAHYERVDNTGMSGFGDVQVWRERGRRVEGRYGTSALPCYVG